MPPLYVVQFRRVGVADWRTYMGPTRTRLADV